ncbi:MAG: helix-turn-helix domain-containing protein [Syntrophobacteraceae bacterium]
MRKGLSSHQKQKITSGVAQLDNLLQGLYIGDNVVWHDDSGNLASAFCQSFIHSSLSAKKHVIYVSFDKSPRNLLEKLGPLTSDPGLTILDCFTSGKGANSPIFLRFYEEGQELPCRLIRLKEPRRIDDFTDLLYATLADLSGDVRLIFESITGMQELWGGEESIASFYSHSCPRLYELNTVAYWVMEKRAHSPRLRAQISQVAQVVIELSIRRGTSFLTIMKAEERALDNLDKPFTYWAKDHSIAFDEEKRTAGGLELGLRLKGLRTRRGLSQTDLAKLVGVTPSTISQVESNLIYPSLPALLKMAEVLNVDMSSFFKRGTDPSKRVVFSGNEGSDVRMPEFPDGSIQARLLTPIDLEPKAEPYLVEIQPEKLLSSHFFVHKGEELGYLICGELQIRVDNETYTAGAGDIIYLGMDMPNQWKNTGTTTAKLLWIKVK